MHARRAVRDGALRVLQNEEKFNEAREEFRVFNERLVRRMNVVLESRFHMFDGVFEEVRATPCAALRSGHACLVCVTGWRRLQFVKTESLLFGGWARGLAMQHKALKDGMERPIPPKPTARPPAPAHPPARP